MVEVTHEGRWTVLRLSGAIDIVSAPRIRKIVDELQSQGRDNLHFDLSGVEFMDSQGLSMLAHARKVALTMDGEIRVSGVSAEMRRLFEITGMQVLLDAGDVAPAAEESPLPPTDSVA